MRNAIGTTDKTPLSHTWLPCPSWCVDDQDIDLEHGPGNAFRVHRGPEWTATMTGQLTRADTMGEGVGHTTVVLDQHDLTPAEARALLDMLTSLLGDLP